MKKIIILLLLAPGLLAADKVYKWLDKQGVIQYSSSPPDASLTQAMSQVDAGGIVSFEKHVPPPSPSSQIAENRKLAESAHCQKLETNLYTLQNNHRVRVRLPNGEYSELSPEEKQVKLSEVSGLFEQHCTQ